MRASTRRAGRGDDSTPLNEVYPAKRGVHASVTRKRDKVISEAPPAQPAACSQTAEAEPAAAAEKAAKASSKTQRKRSKKAKSCQKQLRQFLESVTVDGDTFKTGDSAYLRMTDDFDEDEFAEVEVCQVCGSAEPEDVPMLECSKCLLGYHLNCLEPPLTAVPKGDWLCPSCVSGRRRRALKPGAATAREHLLSGGKKLALVQIQALWQEPDGSQCFAGRWYEIPENTVHGRQQHHAAREVMLTQAVDNNDVESLWKPAQVCLPHAFDQAEGDDVFLCEYEYDTIFQRFRPRRTEMNEDDSDWAAEADSASDGEGDKTFKPEYAYWAEKGTWKGTSKKAPRGRGAAPSSAHNRRRAHQQGGEGWEAAQRDSLSGAGAAEIAAGRGEGLGEGATPMARAQALLALTAVPRSMPCRDNERAAITAFVEESLAPGSSGGRCLYVSGVPGTGKTATVLETMRRLRRQAEGGDLPPFQFVEMNSLRLPSPQHAYTHLYEALTGDHVGATAAAAALEEMFSGGGGGGRSGTSKRVTILLVDEMDLLVTKKQTVLYNLFEWPTKPRSRLAVIGVANTMDLPERLLPRIASRLGSRRVVFQPYSRQQLETIAKTRLEGLNVFEPRAIEYAARKVAAVSGDVRRCLELLRRAAEITDARNQQLALGDAAAASTTGQPAPTGMVKMSHVDDAINEMFQATHMQMMRNCCRLEKLLLTSILLESRAKGHTDVVMENVHTRLEGLCQGHSEPRVSMGEAVAAAARLGSKRLILADPGAKRLYMRMSLNMPVDDLSHVLKHEETIQWLKDMSF